jgi:uncharacterized protein
VQVWRSLLLVAVLLAIAACGGDGDSNQPGDGNPNQLVLETSGGEVELDIEVADSEEELERGRMGRTELPERAGMLFLFRDTSEGAFWMKDTLIPLSIAFIDADGEIVRILDMEPCEADPCPLYDPGLAYRAALEVNQGAFGRLGIDVGDVARLPG